jgi:hypothetical protein
MKPHIKQVIAIVGTILSVLTFWVSIPLVVPVICIGVAVVLD